MLPPAVLWADPGKMTGVSVLYRKADGSPDFWADELDFNGAAHLIADTCHFYGKKLAIGWERFDINASTHKKTREGIYDALHIIGVCRYASWRYDCRVLEPAQQHTPDTGDRRRLEALGWWVPGKDDAQSAACHMLRWLMRENELTPAMRHTLYPDG